MSGSPLVQGFDLVNGKKLTQAHTRTVVARALTTITPGYGVQIVTNTPNGLYVDTCKPTTQHCILGVYNGQGGSATVQTNVTNLNGIRVAVTDDQIEVAVEGPQYVRAKMAATNKGTLTGAYAPLAITVSTGLFEIPDGVTTLANGVQAKVFVLGTNGTNTNVTTVEASGILAYLNP